MTIENCTEKARQQLEEAKPNASPKSRQAIAEQMCQLLDSGILERDLDEQSPDIAYLISRLEIREGEDDPTLKMKWNSWVGHMNYLEEGDYNRFQI